ncbi:sigma-54 interaction domain-containing protein [Sedimentibacter hydroxybenzoicus]|nr:sigma 54-interacting transcriptional regulator [Sedimentibacter hydroxybenzoicus]
MNRFNELKIIIDDLSDGIFVFDENKNCLVNKKFKTLFMLEDYSFAKISDALQEYGLSEIFNESCNTEYEIFLKNRRYSVDFFLIDNNDDSNFKVVLFKELINIEEAETEIEELRQGLNSMKDILDNAYQGIVLVDNEGKIVKWNYEQLFGIKEEDVLGKPVEEIIENTRLHIVIKTGQKELYDIQRIQGHDMIASRTPIIKNGKIIGAVGTVLFKDIKEVKELASKIKTLENTVNIYKKELGKMYCANYSFDDIITQNQKVIEMKDIALKAANSSSTILIEGESGTGKEFFAHAIHHASIRKKSPFIRINCAAIPHELLESELFGYESGAFTGAKKEGKIGKLELANGGTVLLDEISSLPFSMQAKLLRVLEEREFERIGGNAAIKVDIKVIACTNEDLDKLVEQNRFRQDLYYRLNVVKINIPPLRERIEDIELLCQDILNKQLDIGFNSKKVSEKSILALKLYDWPGNVRELRNVLERAANISTGNIITMQHLPDFISEKLIFEEQKSDNKYLKDNIAKAEINAIMYALKEANGNRTEAAKILGIHRTALYKKLANYGINIKNIV